MLTFLPAMSRTKSTGTIHPLLFKSTRRLPPSLILAIERRREFQSIVFAAPSDSATFSKDMGVSKAWLSFELPPSPKVFWLSLSWASEGFSGFEEFSGVVSSGVEGDSGCTSSSGLEGVSVPKGGSGIEGDSGLSPPPASFFP